LSLVGIPYDSSLPGSYACRARHSQHVKKYFGTTGVLIGAPASPLFGTVGPLAMGMVVGGIGLVTIWLTLIGLREKDCPVDQSIDVGRVYASPFGNLANHGVCFQSDNSWLMPCC